MRRQALLAGSVVIEILEELLLCIVLDSLKPIFAADPNAGRIGVQRLQRVSGEFAVEGADI
jgi:hypothetical protein